MQYPWTSSFLTHEFQIFLLLKRTCDYESFFFENMSVPLSNILLIKCKCVFLNLLSIKCKSFQIFACGFPLLKHGRLYSFLILSSLLSPFQNLSTQFSYISNCMSFFLWCVQFISLYVRERNYSACLSKSTKAFSQKNQDHVYNLLTNLKDRLKITMQSAACYKAIKINRSCFNTNVQITAIMSKMQIT